MFTVARALLNKKSNGVLVATCLSFSALATPPQMPPAPVEAVKVAQQEISHGVTTTGELLANHSIVLKSEVAGKVSKLNLPEGKWVDKDTLLIELNDDVAKATLNQVTSKYTNSKLKYERLQTLAKKGTGSASEKDEAQSGLNFDEASVDLAKAQLEKTKLRAPFAGVLGVRQVDAGEYIDPGQALINLEDISSLLVDFRIPEKFLKRIHEGQVIEISSEALPQQVFTGKIYAIAPQIDNVTRTIQARASLPNEKNILRPGLFAKVKVIFEKNLQAMTVPEEAVFMTQNKSYVYKIVKGKAALTEVSTGTRENGIVEILSGLSPTDVIVKSGHMRLFEGAPVAVVNSKP